MLILPVRRTGDGAELLVAPDGATPVRIAVRVPGGIGVDTTADPAVPVALLPAMRRGEPLRCPSGISPRLRTGAAQFQRVLTSWDRHLHGDALRFAAVRIDAPARRTLPRPGRRRGTACFFTGGVDSFHSVLTNLDRLDALIHVDGFGTPPPDTAMHALVLGRLREAAGMLGLPLIEIACELQAFGNSQDLVWDEYHGSALASIALLLAPQFSSVLIPATDTYADLVPLGSHPLLDPLWSTERVEIVHDGADASRLDKLRTAAGHPAGRAHLQVCWEHRNERYNCGECEKCVRTGVAVRLAGLTDAFADLPVPSNSAVARTRPAGRGRAWAQLDAAGGDESALRWAIRFARARHAAAGSGGGDDGSMSPAVADAARQIAENGYVVLPDLLGAAEVDAAVRALEEVFAEEADIAADRGWLTDAYRIGYLLPAKHRVFTTMWDRPAMVDLARAVLGDDAVLASFNGMTMLPGGAGQALHRDHPVPTPGVTLFMNIVCALDPFTPENGATRLVGGTHLSPVPGSATITDAERADLEDLAVTLELAPGSAVAFDATLWHAASPNTTRAQRRALHIFFARSWVQPHWDFPASLPEPVAAGLTDAQRRLLGFSPAPARYDATGRRVLWGRR